MVEIVHEALLGAWPRLRGWINENRADLLVRQHLADAAHAWDRESLLYWGSRLVTAREWASTGPPPPRPPRRQTNCAAEISRRPRNSPWPAVGYNHRAELHRPAQRGEHAIGDSPNRTHEDRVRVQQRRTPMPHRLWEIGFSRSMLNIWARRFDLAGAR